MAKKDEEPGTDMVNWEEKMMGQAKEVARAETPSAGYISLRGGLVSYQGQPAPENKLPVVILNSAWENTHYRKEDKYDPNNPRTPNCFAIATSEEGMGPHPLSTEPQAEACATCEKLKWGSSYRENSRGKACQERRRLIMIPATSAVDEESILAAEVAIMKLPVTSVKHWSQYVNNVASLTRRAPIGVVTEISAKPNAKSQFDVVFTQLELVDASLFGPLFQKQELVESILLKGYEAADEVEGEPASTDVKGS